MKQGYDVFGKAYGVMLRNDVHAPGSIDHKLLREMVLLDAESAPVLYGSVPPKPDLGRHELYAFAQGFRGGTDRQTIGNILKYCAEIAADYAEPFETMRFGGTEREILDRGTDWCADMARVGAVLLMCCGIPARIVNLVNPGKAYHGHVVTEAFYEGKYGVCDFLHGLRFYGTGPLDAWELLRDPAYLADYPADYAGLYTAAAVGDYDPMADNDYTVSGPNDYTLKLIATDHHGEWFMEEDQS